MRKDTQKELNCNNVFGGGIGYQFLVWNPRRNRRGSSGLFCWKLSDCSRYLRKSRSIKNPKYNTVIQFDWIVKAQGEVGGRICKKK